MTLKCKTSFLKCDKCEVKFTWYDPHYDLWRTLTSYFSEWHTWRGDEPYYLGENAITRNVEFAETRQIQIYYCTLWSRIYKRYYRASETCIFCKFHRFITSTTANWDDLGPQLNSHSINNSNNIPKNVIHCLPTRFHAQPYQPMICTLHRADLKLHKSVSPKHDLFDVKMSQAPSVILQLKDWIIAQFCV